MEPDDEIYVITSLNQDLGEASVVVRTDFSDDAAFLRMWQAATVEDEEFGEVADLVCLADRALEGASVDDLVRLVADTGRYVPYLFVADAEAQAAPDFPLQLIYTQTGDDDPDVTQPPTGSHFRLPAEQVFIVHANLSLHNMGFDEFAEAVGEDGVFRGFED